MWIGQKKFIVAHIHIMHKGKNKQLSSIEQDLFGYCAS